MVKSEFHLLAVTQFPEVKVKPLLTHWAIGRIERITVCNIRVSFYYFLSCTVMTGAYCTLKQRQVFLASQTLIICAGKDTLLR